MLKLLYASATIPTPYIKGNKQTKTKHMVWVHDFDWNGQAGINSN